MGSIMSIGRSKAKLYSTERPSTTFDDVAGYDGVKLEISEVVDFLKTPARFKEIGARIPKGILLVGPPGTGKTLLARAVAGEAGVPFMSVSGSDFMEMFVGVGASRVRDLFATARKQAPAIVFIDEIDSIGRKRGAGLGGGHDEREQTLNQMLSEMDGFDPTEGIVVMAATNRPDILDAAILRPGRFDRQIVVPLPDLDERLPILQVHCKDKRVDPTVDLGNGGPRHPGHERGRPGQPGQRGRPPRRAPRLQGHPERGLRGVPRPGPDGPAPREPGAVRTPRRSGWPSTRAATPCSPTCCPTPTPSTRSPSCPTGMALGVTMQLPMEERHIHPRQHIEDSLAVRMGGRAAELLVYGDLSTGASNDLVGNTELARKMVREWGMSDKIGPDGLGLPGPGVPGRGPHAHPRLLGAHQPDHRRRGGASSSGPRSSGPSRCWPATGAASTPWPGPCSTRRPSTARRWAAWSTPPTGGRSTSTASRPCRRSSWPASTVPPAPTTPTARPADAEHQEPRGPRGPSGAGRDTGRGPPAPKASNRQ